MAQYTPVIPLSRKLARSQRLRNAAFLDDLVRSLVLDHLRDQHAIALNVLDASARDSRLRGVTDQVVLAHDTLSIALNRGRIEVLADELRRAAAPSEPAPLALPTTARCPFSPLLEERGGSVVLRMPIAIKKGDGKRLLVTPDGQVLLRTVDANGQPVPRPHIVRAIGQAFAWQRELNESGCTLREVGRESQDCGTRVRALLVLTQLAPVVVKAALTGALSETVTLENLEKAAQHLDRDVQQRILGLSGGRAENKDRAEHRHSSGNKTP